MELEYTSKYVWLFLCVIFLTVHRLPSLIFLSPNTQQFLIAFSLFLFSLFRSLYQYDQPNGNEWITGSGGTAVHAGGLFWDGVNDRGGAQYARFDGFVKRNEAVEFFFQEPAVIKEIEINPCCNDDSYRLVKFRLERWSDKDSQWETVSRFYNPSRPDTARLVTGLSGASERAQSWRLLFPRDAIPGSK